MRQIFKPIIIMIATTLFSGFSPNYYSLKLEDQKVQFAKIISNLAQSANEKTLQKREFALKFLDEIYQKGFRNLDFKKVAILKSIQKEYKISNIFSYSEYQLKLDAVPISLAIAQAAVESGWGKSRFAREANNLFGHWTWGDKGLIPLNRDEDKSHKIKIFDSIADSVAAYALNLNSHPAYNEFRKVRAQHRKNGQIYSGLEAAKTMEKYSAIGLAYVKQLEKTITLYNLQRFDNPIPNTENLTL